MSQATRVFRVDFTPAAIKQFNKLDPSIQIRLRPVIDAFANDPIPLGAKKMKGTGVDPLWRVRVGDYRIVYKVEGHRLVVLIVKIGHRREVYR